MSFGVAAASLVTAYFIPDRFNTDSAQMLHGIHEAFLVLGAMTVASAAVFSGLKSDDGDNVSQHKIAHAVVTGSRARPYSESEAAAISLKEKPIVS